MMSTMHYFGIIVILALFGCSSDSTQLAPSIEENQPPEIIALSTSSSVVHPGETVSIQIRAVDPENDYVEVSYNQNSNITYNSSELYTWSAPFFPGTYTLEFIATDSFGNTTSRQTNILVFNDFNGTIFSQVDVDTLHCLYLPPSTAVEFTSQIMLDSLWRDHNSCYGGQGGMSAPTLDFIDFRHIGIYWGSDCAFGVNLQDLVNTYSRYDTLFVDISDIPETSQDIEYYSYVLICLRLPTANIPIKFTWIDRQSNIGLQPTPAPVTPLAAAAD